MKIKSSRRSFPFFRVLSCLGGLLFSGSVRAQSWDYDYIVTRFLDPGTGYVVSEIDNYYAADTFGNPLFTNSLPVYLGVNPDISNPFWIDPGFFLQITNRPGGGLTVSGPKALPPGGGGGGGGQVFGKGVTQINKHAGILTITAAAPGAEISYRPKGTTQFGPWMPVHVGDQFGPGCMKFRNGPVSWIGCEVTLDPLSGGEFSGMYAIMGGGTNWPGLFTPAFFEDKQWDLAYIGNSDNPFDGTGFGRATILCLDNAFMSVATPEFYVGCVPEPDALGLFGLGALLFLAVNRFMRK